MVSTMKTLFLRQPDHQIGIRVIGTEIEQLDRGAAEVDGFLAVYCLIRQGRVRVLERSQMLRDLLVPNDCGPGVLERLAAGDVIVVMVAVDQIFDRLVGDFFDLVDVLLAAVRPAVGDRVGRDHAVLGNHEHRLMVAIAEDVDVISAVNLLGLDLRPLLRLCRHAEHGGQQRGPDGCE
jgi:hypothetical protein